MNEQALTNEQQIIQRLDQDLNREGRTHGITFDVSSTFRPDGDWTQFFVVVHDNGKRPAAEQIIADVEERLSQAWGRELLVVRTAP